MVNDYTASVTMSTPPPLPPPPAPLPRVSRVRTPLSVVFLCAQSMFKLHPRFDVAVERVLQASTSNYVVFTEGRRRQWTKDFTKRLRRVVGDELMERVRGLYTLSLLLGQTSGEV